MMHRAPRITTERDEATMADGSSRKGTDRLPRGTTDEAPAPEARIGPARGPDGGIGPRSAGVLPDGRSGALPESGAGATPPPAPRAEAPVKRPFRALRPVAALWSLWAVTRAVLLLCVFKVLVVPGPDVTSDVAVIYQSWFRILRTGTFPLDDVTWQYPPAAALPVLSPGLLPFLDYPSAFFLLACAADAVVLALLLRAGGQAARRLTGAWVWLAGVPLLGHTAYARYDVMVTGVAVAALLALPRHPRTAGALAAFGALLKVWPVLLLAGTARGRSTRAAWTAAAVTGTVLTLLCAAAVPGAFAFLTFQRDRGTEVESLGSLVFHVARHLGWDGQVLLNYGSVEYLGPYVGLVSGVSLALTAAALGWLLLWRRRAVRAARGCRPGHRCSPWADGHGGPAALPADAAFTAVLLFTTTSRVISPQYLLWLLGLAAVCLTLHSTLMTVPAVLVLLAAGATQLEFPIWFSHVVAGDPLGIAVLAARNGLLVAAALLACARLWRAAAREPRLFLPPDLGRGLPQGLGGNLPVDLRRSLPRPAREKR
ncbi:glycosyltransferase family 87 protein [Streptomyces sp. NPDC002055]|uniref:glycosyltransferase family 87 protein n=1 Tax=Streptomyces sp. NPDC002055 TaxID=3154534 RepID=UPI00331C61C9